MFLDRKMQEELLLRLREDYPEPVEFHEIAGSDDRNFQQNAFYLKEHELIEGWDTQELGGTTPTVETARITKLGLDHLEDDGGIDAIRRTVIVRLEADEIRALMTAKIEAADIPATQKVEFLERLKSLVGKAFDDTILKFLKDAMNNPEGLVRIFSQIT
ncbi:MAG: hypothetical protein V3W41_00330 [Planctomycetota bacterium]